MRKEETRGEREGTTIRRCKYKEREREEKERNEKEEKKKERRGR